MDRNRARPGAEVIPLSELTPLATAALAARKIMLVEGPAEVFLVPPLLRHTKGIDLDGAGVAIIPIHGIHFHDYATLLAPGTPPGKCAIVADRDLRPSDADETINSLDTPSAPPDLSALESAQFRVFTCKTSFERAITIEGNLGMLALAADDIGAPLLAQRLRLGEEALNDTRLGEAERKDILKPLRQMVLDTARRFGKARFAQLAAGHAERARDAPKYLVRAATWLIET